MITLKNVVFGYQRGKPIYKGLDLTLETGAIYGLLGPNGAGKSTLLRLVAGLLYPKAGQVKVGDFSPGKRQPTFLENIFFVPEEFYLPPVRIRQFIGSNAPFYPRFNLKQMSDYLLEFGLNEEQKLHELSLGQRKKVLIGFGLATNTAVLLMDEPTNGLDIPSKSQFRRLIAGAVDHERTVLISTHQVRDLEMLIDPVVILTEQGQALTVTVEEIGRQLWFGLQPELTTERRILYAERAVGGYAVVAENPAYEPSRLDLERLFNAVQANPERMFQLFSASPNYVQV